MVFQVVEAYLYLSPADMMDTYSGLIVSSCMKLFSELRTDGLLMILKLVEIIFRLFPVQGKTTHEMSFETFRVTPMLQAKAFSCSTFCERPTPGLLVNQLVAFRRVNLAFLMERVTRKVPNGLSN
jgi:hypothetical protein